MIRRHIGGVALLCAALALAEWRPLWWALQDHLRGGAAERVAWTDSLPEALGRAVREQKPVYVDFTADWCGPCQAMLHEAYRDPALARRLNGRFVPVLIDVDRQPALAARFAVSGIPAIAVLAPGGEPLARTAGYADAATLVRLMDAAEARLRRRQRAPARMPLPPSAVRALPDSSLPPLPPLLP